MGVHEDEVSMLRESLPEYLGLAWLGLTHRKPNGGVLGYPSAQLLFAIVDAIGSYYRGHPTFTVMIDGRPRRITTTGEHVFILNSEFFGLALSEAQLWNVYKLLRSPLTHNALVGIGHALVVSDPEDAPIHLTDGRLVTNLAALFVKCDAAVRVFLGAVGDLVPSSEAIRDLRMKAEAEAGKRFAAGGKTPSAS